LYATLRRRFSHAKLRNQPHFARRASNTFPRLTTPLRRLPFPHAQNPPKATSDRARRIENIYAGNLVFL